RSGDNSSESAAPADLTANAHDKSLPTASYSSSTTAAEMSQPLPTGATISINFDDVGPYVNVSTRYPHVVFSSAGPPVITISQEVPSLYQSSPPNAASPYSDPFGGISDFIATFDQPVTNLRFVVVGSDSIGTIASIDIYQNG